MVHMPYRSAGSSLSARPPNHLSLIPAARHCWHFSINNWGLGLRFTTTAPVCCNRFLRPPPNQQDSARIRNAGISTWTPPPRLPGSRLLSSSQEAEIANIDHSLPSARYHAGWVVNTHSWEQNSLTVSQVGRGLDPEIRWKLCSEEVAAPLHSPRSCTVESVPVIQWRLCIWPPQLYTPTDK